jgi:hypothetical protein
MTLPLIEGRSFNSELYNRALSSAYRVWLRLYDQDYALAREPDAWEKIHRDPTICQAIEQRLNAVAARSWRIEAATDQDDDAKAAQVIEEILGQVRQFQSARKILAGAIFRARTYAFIEGRPQTFTITDDQPRTWWIPLRLRDVDRRRVRHVPIHTPNPDGGETLSVETQLWSVDKSEYVPMAHPEYFVRVIYNDEEGRLSSGRGLMDSLYFYWWIKGIIWREGLGGLERWSQGIVIGKIDSLREGITTKQNEDVRDEMFEALRDMRSRHVLVVGKEDEIEVKDGGMQGHQMVTTFLKYIDEKILALCLGSSLPYGGGESGGSYARAAVEENSAEQLVQFDRQKMDEDLTNSLIALVWRMNRGVLVAMGLGNARMPRFSSVQEKKEDPQIAAQIITQMGQAGLPLRMDEVYHKIGFSKPREGVDEVFEGAAPDAGSMPGMPGGMPEPGGQPFTEKPSHGGPG